MHTIKIGNIEFNLEIERKRNRNMYLRIKGEKQLHVSAPLNVPEERIFDFILSKESWILAHYKEAIVKSERKDMMELNNPIVNLLGKKYFIKYIKSNRNDFEISDDIITIWAKDEASVKTIFEKHTRKMLEEVLNQKRGKFDRILEDYRVQLPSISIRKMSAKWGYCSPKVAKIVMNYSLVFLPIGCIEYVLLHEYIHMIVPNHSKRFYQIIENYMPDYKKYVEYLKKGE